MTGKCNIVFGFLYLVLTATLGTVLILLGLLLAGIATAIGWKEKVA